MSQTIADTELRDRVRALVADLLSRPLTPDQDDRPLAEIDADRYDSLGVLDCVGAVEQELDVSIDLVDDDLRVTFRSVAAIADLVARKHADEAALGWTS